MDEIIKGYEQEIAYQKHMIENLGRFLSLSIMIAAIGIMLVYFFPFQNNAFLCVIGWILFIIGVLAMLLFGYGIYRGRQNVNLVIEDLNRRLHSQS